MVTGELIVLPDSLSEAASPVSATVGVHSGSVGGDPGKKNRRRPVPGLAVEKAADSDKPQHSVDSLA
jgi:hypothetical protein